MANRASAEAGACQAAWPIEISEAGAKSGANRAAGSGPRRQARQWFRHRRNLTTNRDL